MERVERDLADSETEQQALTADYEAAMAHLIAERDAARKELRREREARREELRVAGLAPSLPSGTALSLVGLLSITIIAAVRRVKRAGASETGCWVWGRWERWRRHEPSGKAKCAV